MGSGQLARHEIVLLGAGHTNAHVVRMWRMQPIPGARLTCINDFPIATYSGMLPGVLAGQYARHQMEIDLVRLCAAVHARFIWGEIEQVDCRSGRIYMVGRPSIAFDLLSIGIGSRPRGIDQVADGDLVVPIKPMQSFPDRLEARLRRWHNRHGRPQKVPILVVGAGVGGIEITFCLPAAVRRWLGSVEVQVSLLEAESTIAPGVTRATRHRILRRLERRGVQVVTGCRAVKAHEDTLITSDGKRWEAAAVVWAPGAEASPLLASIDAQRDEQGFLLIRPTLQTVDHDRVFAVGDCATIVGQPVPKAGVYAVRQGPYLWENLHRLLAGHPLLEYHPQRRFLKLINLGDGSAIGEYCGVAFEGRVWWRLKDSIDSRFIAKYQNYQPAMQPTPPPMLDGAGGKSLPTMRCLGCGGKVSASVLSRVLRRLDVPSHPQVVLGLDRPDDAAILQVDRNRFLSVTVDFFAPPLDDAYTAGRIAALHAASDCFAMGGRPFAALASVTLPYGSPARQEELLYELLAGALYELRRMGATLVGGHTIEGPQLTIGFTLLANQPPAPALEKIRLQVGDRLLLTKPLGTGILLAAHMRALCRYDWYERLVGSMLRSNQPEAEFAAEQQASAITDVTGFGLIGHLVQMLQPTGLSATINLDQLPLLDGCCELIQQGIESTLAPENRRWESQLEAESTVKERPEYAALFDPQTSGGLLIAVPADRTNIWDAMWQKRYGCSPWWIGEVVSSHETSRVRVQAR